MFPHFFPAVHLHECKIKRHNIYTNNKQDNCQMKNRILLTDSLYTFLLDSGYLYIQVLGHDKKMQNSNKFQEENYILVPRRNDITQQFEEALIMLKEIHDMDVLDMLEVVPGIHFWVDLPEAEAKMYNLTRRLRK